MLPWCDVVICDYNYVFDPLVGLGYFRDNRERIALLVDEAHNLVDRSRQMYSAQLTRSLNQQAVANCKTANPSLSKTLGGVTRALDRWQKLQDASETVVNAAPATVSRAVDRLLKLLAQQAEHSVGIAANVAEWLKEIYRYRHIAEIFGDQHRCITQCRHRGTGRDVRIRLWCVNANTALAAIYRCFHGVVLFSATLRPQTYYREALGLPARTLSLSLPSPFPVDHLGCFVCRAIDTRYHQRPASIEPIAELIHTVYQSRPGNYLVFFPSYQYLQQVAQVLAQQHPTLALVCQQRDADEQARSAFLQQFQARRNTLGLAIMGGVYGEGVDYRGDSLIGAIVVGIGLPAMETEQQLIREDFERKHRNGFDFAYRYPGVARVLQAAGRVIRSDSDRGVVVLIDQRFYRSDYRQLLPEHWLLQPCQTAAQLDSGLRQFWGGHDAEDG
jgi:Rad3-related DNA helicase